MKMKKNEFLAALSRRLSALPPEEAEKSLSFYAEMIDDRVEDGMTQEEAVAALGSLDEIVASIINQLPLATVVKERVNSSRKKAKSPTLWMILAICGFPIWLPLTLVFVILVLTVYMVAWILIAALVAVLLALVASGVLGIIVGLIRCIGLGVGIGLFTMGVGILCAGLVILGVYPVGWLVRRLVQFTAWFGRKVKELFLRKVA